MPWCELIVILKNVRSLSNHVGEVDFVNIRGFPSPKGSHMISRTGKVLPFDQLHSTERDLSDSPLYDWSLWKNYEFDCTATTRYYGRHQRYHWGSIHWLAHGWSYGLQNFIFVSNAFSRNHPFRFNRSPHFIFVTEEPWKWFQYFSSTPQQRQVLV